LVSYLTRLRNDAEFTSFYERVVSTARGLTDDPAVPRVRTRPSRYEDGSTGFEFPSAELFFRQKYYEAIDAALQALANRFEANEGQKLMSRIEGMLLRAANTFDKDLDAADRAVFLNYPEIDTGRLVLQISMFSDYLKRLNEKHNQQVKEITKISTISSLLVLEDSINCAKDNVLRNMQAFAHIHVHLLNLSSELSYSRANLLNIAPIEDLSESLNGPKATEQSVDCSYTQRAHRLRQHKGN
jgi:hypothetical protein